MNERIKKVRTYTKLSQTDFAEKISVSRSAVCKMESGENAPSEQTIKLICAEFDINEEWLRTGNGDMTIPISKDKEISRMLATVLKSDENDFKRRLISALSRLDDEGWEQLEILIDMISGTK